MALTKPEFRPSEVIALALVTAVIVKAIESVADGQNSGWVDGEQVVQLPRIDAASYMWQR